MTGHRSLTTNLCFSVPGSEDHEPELRLTYHVTPGAPATGPTYDCGGEPGYGPEVELYTAYVKIGDDWIALPEWMFGMLYSDQQLLGELLNDAAEDDDRLERWS